SVFMLQEGWAYSFKLLRDGRRQIVGFAVPGDFLGLHSVLLPKSNYSAMTLTDAVVSEVDAERLGRIIRRRPGLGSAILWSASWDTAMLVEHLVDVGRRNAIERLARLLLELQVRLELVGLGSDRGFECPLTQGMLADALGLSIVHVNRTLRQLRERGLATVDSGRVVVNNPEGLRALAACENIYPH
ncbi:MAG: Crp/Fnr family transcriptional regulator, partial [Alphaproteobacteria bacterium]